MGDDSAVASSFGNDGLRRVVAGVDIDIGKSTKKHIWPGQSRIACTTTTVMLNIWTFIVTQGLKYWKNK